MTDLVGGPEALPEPAPPIDPLRPTVDGCYRDPVVEVSRGGPRLPRRTRDTVRTPHFDVRTGGRRIVVEHRVEPAAVDDDLAGLLADELFGPGWLRGAELFERIFTGVVLSSAADPLAGWELFYRNTLARIEEATAGPADESGSGRHGTIAGYAPVYAHTESLLPPGSTLELGCCFGFLSLRLAATGREVLASDLSSGTVRLLSEVAPRLGVQLDTRVADAARFPGRPGAVADTVLAIHLLEHLEPDHGDRVLAEAVRLARRRVVIAVPLETEANETWGHLRTIGLDDLDRWGAATGRPYDVHEHHGGWLVIDTA